MKKTYLLPALFTVLSLFFTGCSSKQTYTPNAIEGECIIKGEDAPKWACGAYDDTTKYTGVGSAPLSKLGHNFSRNEALLNARNNLVNKVSLEIKNKTESFMRSTGLGENEMVEKVVKQVSRHTANMVLNDSKQLSYWQNEADDTIFVLVGVSKQNIQNTIDSQIEDIVANDAQLQNAQRELNEL